MGFWEVGKKYWFRAKDGNVRTAVITAIEGNLIFYTDRNGAKRGIDKDSVEEVREIGGSDGRTC